MRLLLIEDDVQLGEAVQTGLTQLGFVIDWLQNSEHAKISLKSDAFDAIILDLGLPKQSGLSFLKEIRHNGEQTPVIILTAYDSVTDRIKGLDNGADDYVTKPFDLHELGARIRALVRRSAGRADALMYYKNIILDPAGHTVRVDNIIMNFSRREFTLLQKLLEHTGQVLSREQLIHSLYNWSEEIDSNTLEVHIHNLRKKLNANYIRTIRGVGYMIEKSEQ